MDLALSGKRAVVAGASRGLGYAIARELAAEGARVAICSREAARIEGAASRIRGETGAEVRAAAVDVTDAAAIRRWLEEVAAPWGGIDLLVPNAGGPPPGRFDDLDEEIWDHAYRLTLRSALAFARHARPHLGPGAAVLFMTSISVKEPMATLALSTIFRPGVASLAKLLADEWAADGIRVNHLVPGIIATERVRSLDEHDAAEAGITPEEAARRRAARVPLGRYGTPREYAAAAVFLLSDAASYVTGATLQVDGGMLREIG